MNILFVCSANRCRSPMAEAMAPMIAREEGFEGRFASAGTGVGPRDGATPHAIEVAKERGYRSLTNHRATALTEQAVEWADAIFGMKKGHVAEARRLGGGDKVKQLSDIPIPSPNSIDCCRETADAIALAMRHRFEELRAMRHRFEELRAMRHRFEELREKVS